VTEFLDDEQPVVARIEVTGAEILA